MSGIIFDTSVYISALRQGDVSLFAARRAVRRGQLRENPLWLSVVVLEELYVGARDTKLKKLLANLEKDFEQVKRLLIPLQADWTGCGQVLGQIGEKYGYEEVGRARLTNDALIAMTARRQGCVVLTKNAKDFMKISEFRPFQWEVI